MITIYCFAICLQKYAQLTRKWIVTMFKKILFKKINFIISAEQSEIYCSKKKKKIFSVYHIEKNLFKLLTSFLFVIFYCLLFIIFH